MLLATDLAVLDHEDGSVLLIANAVNYDATDERVDEAWADAVARLDAMDRRRSRSRPRRSAVDLRLVGAELDQRQPRLARATGRRSRRGQGGDPGRRGFQIVVSQRFELPTDARPRSTSTGCCA